MGWRVGERWGLGLGASLAAFLAAVGVDFWGRGGGDRGAFGGLPRESFVEDA